MKNSKVSNPETNITILTEVALVISNVFAVITVIVGALSGLIFYGALSRYID